MIAEASATLALLLALVYWLPKYVGHSLWHLWSVVNICIIVNCTLLVLIIDALAIVSHVLTWCKTGPVMVHICQILCAGLGCCESALLRCLVFQMLIYITMQGGCFDLAWCIRLEAVLGVQEFVRIWTCIWLAHCCQHQICKLAPQVKIRSTIWEAQPSAIEQLWAFSTAGTWHKEYCARQPLFRAVICTQSAWSDRVINYTFMEHATTLPILCMNVAITYLMNSDQERATT